MTEWAYISNNLVYAAMAVFALSFVAHAFETAFAVRTPESKDATTGSKLVQTLDYKRTEKAARIATTLMALGFILLLVELLPVESRISMFPGAICMSSQLQELSPLPEPI